jgi:hypothetical protein
MILVRTFLDTRLAVGRFGWILGYGNVRPTVAYQRDPPPLVMRYHSLATAIGMMTKRSMYKNWKSPRLDANEYN